ncbi:MAG: type II secretion system protein [Deltaproteobacteria bacterium]|nr:type II secretion system protein [Deltaproteobacteria bacterium]
MGYKRNMNKKGFTLIEVVMIIVILGIMLPGIMMYFIQGVKNSADSQRRATAIFLAEGLMEEIKSKRWDEVAVINATCSNASAIGADAEARIAYDDIDDFSGMNNATPVNSQGAVMVNYPNFQQQVTVSYVNAAALNTAVGGPTCYKRIEVRIIDTATSETIKLVSLRTGY